MKIFDMPYFEVKYYNKLLIEDVLMLHIIRIP